MSRTVVSYIEGKPQYRDDGPAYARRQGFGGSAIGFFSAVVLTHAQRKATQDAAKRERHPKDGAGARKL